MLVLIFALSLLLKASFGSEIIYMPFTVDLEKLEAFKNADLQDGNSLTGRNIFKSRKVNCLSCHEAPMPEERFQGNFGPSLIGVGSKYTKEEIRMRVIDSKLINPDSIMPSYFKEIKYPRTPENFLGKTILKAEEVEHIVEYLYSLK